MNNEQYYTFDKKSSGLNTIKEEDLSILANTSTDEEIRYMRELKYLIEVKIKEINQESNLNL